ncbi:MAG: nitrous oxide-stimulated promoter family protein [Muribaculaceae bacterium]|nr:nitrous oxide-stimulated promoter family protein [Muribaculaceae bacterium]
MTHRDEIKVVTTMITEYCRRRHHTSDDDSMCLDCQELLDYAVKRLTRCPRGESRDSCRKCVIHCYDTAHRESMRQVMSYIGPRMIYLHPVMAVKHLFGEIRRKE